MPLIIRMDGLMCHVGDDAKFKRDVVLVDNAPTTPHLSIEADYRVDPEDGDVNETLIKGDVITFSGDDLPSGPARTSEIFQARVPGLQLLLEDVQEKNILDPLVKKQDPDALGVIVYVTYPGGTLAAVKDVGKLKFAYANGHSKEMIVADEAVFTSTNAEPATLTIHRRKGTNPPPIQLKADAVVKITNRVCRRENHFDKYVYLTKAGKMAKAESFRLEYTDNPECTNSGWP